MRHLIISFLTFSFLITSINAQDRPNKNTKDIGYSIGDKIENFSLPNTDGDMVSLSNYKDANGYIIVFTSNVCPFAIGSEQRLIRMHKDMAALGYPLIAINSNAGEEEGIESMKKKATELNIPFEYLKDNASVHQKFGATKTPHAFIVDKNMILQYMGSIDDNPRSEEDVEELYLVNAVKSLVDNRTPNPAVTKSIGCPIKSEGNNTHKGRKGPPNPKAIMERMDNNKDGEISKNEAKGPLAKDFDNLDTDKDGILTIAELTKSKALKKRN